MTRWNDHLNEREIYCCVWEDLRSIISTITDRMNSWIIAFWIPRFRDSMSNMVLLYHLNKKGKFRKGKNKRWTENNWKREETRIPLCGGYPSMWTTLDIKLIWDVQHHISYCYYYFNSLVVTELCILYGHSADLCALKIRWLLYRKTARAFHRRSPQWNDAENRCRRSTNAENDIHQRQWQQQ